MSSVPVRRLPLARLAWSLLVLGALALIHAGHLCATVWKTVYVDVDGDGVDEPLSSRTDEDVYHLGALESYHLHVGILGSGPGWGLRYTAWRAAGPLLDTGVRGEAYFYHRRDDFLQNENVVTEWEADSVLLRRVIDLTSERAIISLGLINLLPDHIRGTFFKSEFRFDDCISSESPDQQTTVGWDGYDLHSPDSPAIFYMLHLAKPDSFSLSAGNHYGLTSAVWGPRDLCAEESLDFALVVLWNAGHTSIDSAETYLEGKLSEFKALDDSIVSKPLECDSVGVAEEGRSSAEGVPNQLICRASPNPFWKRTTVVCEVPATAHGSLRIYSATGRLVRVLREGELEAGVYPVVWSGLAEDGMEVPAGVYFCTLKEGVMTTSDRLVLLR